MKSWFGNRPTNVRTSDWTNRRSKDSWNQRKRSGKGYARFDMSSAPWRKPAEKPEFSAAVENGNEKKVARLISDDADIEETYQGLSPLMKAAEENEAAITCLLLQHRADVDIKNDEGRTALSFAVAPSRRRKTAYDMMQLLLFHKADPTGKDETGLTVKARAVREKRQDELAILKEYTTD